MGHLKDTVAGQLRAAFEAGKGGWGPTLMDALDGVAAEHAAWQPNADLRAIGEIVNHVTYWKNEALKKLDPGAVSHEAPAEDWQAVTDAAGWHRALDQLAHSQAALAAGLDGMDEAALQQAPQAKGWPAWKDVFLAMAAHDAYHTGQVIQLRQQQGLA